MPLAQKVLQLLVQEYDTLLQGENGKDEAVEDDDSDDAELDDHEIPQDLLHEGFAPADDYRDFLTDLMSQAGGELEETDPDILEDPLYKMNLKAEIENFVKNVARTHMAALQQMATVLTAEERTLLEAIVRSQ